MSVPRQPAILVVDDSTPSQAFKISDLISGDAVEQRFAFDGEQRRAFSVVANDRAPVHNDARFAHTHGFSGPVIQGLCVSTRFSRLIGMYLPGELAILESVSLKYRQPTYEGQKLTFRAEVIRLLPVMNVVRLALSASSEQGVHVSGEAQCLIR